MVWSNPLINIILGSGTAAVIEMLKIFATDPPEQTVFFQLFSGFYYYTI